MTVTDVAVTTQRRTIPFEVRRSFTIGGRAVNPGDTIDLADFDLPPGREQQLVAQRYGVFCATGADPVPLADLHADQNRTASEPVIDDGRRAELGKLKKDRLLDLCREAEVPVYGSKQNLIDRLLEAGA